jgi:Domain of unknown function (DUF222)/HNH endonuclease
MFDILEARFETEAATEVAPEDLIEELIALFVRRDRDEARIARLLGEMGESRAFDRDGYSSLTAFLKHRMSLHPGEAQRLVARANGLIHAPITSLAFARGVISGSQVDVLLETRRAAPEHYDEDEARLVALAMDVPLVRDLKKQLDYWLDQVAPDDLGADRNQVRDLRYLTLRREGEMIRINGWLDIEAGERLRACLEPGPPAEGDGRSTPARRADVLLDILNGASDRPDLIVHVSAETLAGGESGISETSHGTFLTADEIQRLACDACLTRVVLDSESRPLDVGRTKRLVTPAIRAAVCARDLRCVFPGCDRPSHWSDVHHLEHWVDGGETRIDNLVLLCRHHHVLVHEGGWALTGAPGDLHFYRPNGGELGADPPPRPARRRYDPSDRPITFPKDLRTVYADLPRARPP